MCKILIVDDEKLLRQGLIQMTDWKSHGFQIVGEASDGREALQRIATTRPDIVIADIRMPVMDGVALTRAIKQRYPWIQVIILSSFSDFEYVRETLKLGAFDYILKPKLELDEMLQVLKKARTQLDSKAFNKQSDDLQTAQTNLIRNTFTNPHFDLKECPRLFTARQIALSMRNLGLLLLYFDSEQPFPGQAGLSAVINAELTSLHPYSLFPDNTTCLVVLNCPAEAEPQLKLQVGQLIKHIRTDYGCNLWVIFKTGLTDIPAAVGAYQAMQSARDFCFYHSKNSLVALVVPRWIPFEPDLKELDPLIDQDDFEAILQKYCALMRSHLSREKYFEPYSLKKNLTEVCYYLWHRLAERSSVATELHQHKFEYLAALENSSTLEELINSFTFIIHDIKRCNDIAKKNQYSAIIRQVISYIGNHYDQETSLSSVAAHVHLNKNYLCHLFKGETGQNFNDYLTTLRINKAKELLRHPDYNIYIICEMVGFSNPSYFGHVFKNLVGMTPSEYGRKIRR